MKFLRYGLMSACTLAVCLATVYSAHAKIEAEAVPGRPFGVGRITVDAAEVGGLIDLERALLFEQDDRILYPAISTTMPGKVIGQLLGTPIDSAPSRITWHFLIRGDGPLRITLQTPVRLQVLVDVKPEPKQREGRLYNDWWKNYSDQTKTQVDSGDYSPVIQVFLQSSLAGRLGLPPTQSVPEAGSAAQKSVELLVAAERLRMEVLRETALGKGDFGAAANLPLPPAHPWPPLPLPAIDPAVAVEPISTRVPEECFYIRFGNFDNYLWMEGLLDEYGGDISSMVTLRGYFTPMNERIQKQLGVKKSALDRLLGRRVISDVALIGCDTYMSEGAAIGVLFQAEDGEGLASGMNFQRNQWVTQEKANGATLEKVEIGGKEVSFLSTPDNTLRSFMVSDDKYVLVTTSRTMVERFLQTGKNDRSLAQTEEFRHARTLMPITRDDTIFVYMSSRFFQELLSPKYQIELRRRMQSVTDIEVLSMARLVAKAEGIKASSLEELQAAQILPPGFGRRPDGSGPIEEGSKIFDSRRGARGTYIPVPDIKIEAVTEQELRRYEQLVSVYQQQWKQMDPLMVGIKRYALEMPPGVVPQGPPLERVVIDGNIAPLNDQKYAFLASSLGPPTQEFILPAPGDIISVQAVLRGGVGLPNIPPHHLFLGVQDMPPLGDFPPKGLLKTIQFLRSTPGYVGGWPTPGFLDALPFGLGGGRPDPYGFSKLLFGLWRRQGGGFSVLSFDFPLLAEVTQHLQVAIAENEAQIRVHIGDLSNAKLSQWIHWNYFQRAQQASASNTKLLHTLHQQLHVPLESCLPEAERLLDAKLRCTLGGKYEVVSDPRLGARYWSSSAWQQQGQGTMPADFQSPVLQWFRGLDMHMTKYDERVVARIELDMARRPEDKTKPKESKEDLPVGKEGEAASIGGLQLPFMGLFSGQGALKPKEAPKGEKPLVPVPKEAIPKSDEPAPKAPVPAGKEL